MDINYYRKYEPLFGSWHIAAKIGEGSFGQVYKIERKELGVKYASALKAITIPQNPSEKQSMLADGMSKENITQYYRGVVQDIVNEFILMSRLKGNSNVVSYEDHIIIEHEDGIGWDILIRMELLTPLYEYISKVRMNKRDIIKFGIDMCKALELCEKNHIIHRDVKPENIFVSENGDYKLGDFGVARTIEESMSGLSKKGTYLYMAPEVYRGEKYGSTVDIYSLGIVMYKLLNGNRAPFMPPYPEPITYTKKKESVERRINGEKIPEPQGGTKKLNEIVLKACEFDPDKRYQSAEKMEQELQVLLVDLSRKQEVSKPIKENSVTAAEAIKPPTQISAADKTKKNWKKKITIIAAAVALLAAVIAFALIPKHVTDIKGLEAENSIYIGDTLAPQYEIEPDKFSDASIEFEVGDNKIIDVDEEGQITAKKIGESTLLLSSKGYEEEVLIKVLAKVTKISNVDKKISIVEGESEHISPELSPEKFSNEKITYKIKNKKIATITKDGTITGIKPGTTKLTISAGGCTKKVTIVVEEYVAPQPAVEYVPYNGADNFYEPPMDNSTSDDSGDVTVEVEYDDNPIMDEQYY